MNYLQELTYDKPITYKELKIYPVLMKDYIEFHSLVSCLLIDKNSRPDIKIISMTYLRFLYYESERTNMPYIYMLKLLLCLVLHLDYNENIRFYTKEDKAYFSIKNIEYNASDFDKIVEIIFLQNSIEPIDESIQKEIRDALQKAEEYKMQQNKRKICSLEEQMICVLISSALKLDDIYNLTIRKFEKILERVDAKLHYQIYMNASMSGFVKFDDKNAITHWMADLTKEKYSDVKVDMDEMKNKINEINK